MDVTGSLNIILSIIYMETLFLKVTEQELNIIKNSQLEYNVSKKVDYKNVVCLKPWGYEFLAYESTKIGIWYLKINKGHRTSLHTHFKKDTFIIIISGTAMINLINNESISLSTMKSLFIPKNKFHGLSCYSDEVYIMEIEIFSKDITFSDKNDLLRIDDQYNRKRTGYESSVSLSDELQDYFYLDNDFKKKIENTCISVTTLDQSIQLSSGYNILLDGELYINGKYLKEGSLIDKLTESDNCSFTKCLILSISNNYAFEDSKLIYSMDHLKTILRMIDSQNKKIVLTSGCYDIIHVGHLHNLKESKKLGDILMTCLTNDLDIVKLKGVNRPINKYKDRINLFKTIPYIDYIILYDELNIKKEETLGEIMKTINPYCWTKGSDYKFEEIIEKHPYLNKVVLIDNIVDISTTKIIDIIMHKVI